MSRYIDADKLVRELQSIKVTFGSGNGMVEGGLEIAISTTNAQPTADVWENARAKIIHAGGKGVTQWFECSECGTPVDLKDNFCKCCGADLRMED